MGRVRVLDYNRRQGIAERVNAAIDAGIGFRANAAVFETGADLWDLLLTIKRD